MQATAVDSHTSAGPTQSGTPGGLLENPHRVRAYDDRDLVVDGRHTAWLRNLSSIRFHSTTDASKSLTWYHVEYAALEWTHRAALLRLQGMPIQRLLGTALLLRGKERPVHAVRPGMDEVSLALIDVNNTGLEGEELFFYLHEMLLEGRVT